MNEEYPVQTDAEEIKELIRQALDGQKAINERLDRYVSPLNSIGENMTWLVQNVQGIFQMFASPQFMSQMSQMISGGIPDGQRASTGTEVGSTGA